MNILRIIAATVSLSLALASGAGLWHTTAAGLHITQERERIIQFDAAAKTLFVELLDAETGQRGYLLTQDAAYLDPYNSAILTLGRTMERMAATAVRPIDQHFIEDVGPLATEKMTLMSRTVELQRAGKREEAMALVKTQRGRYVMDALRTLMTNRESSTRYYMDWSTRVLSDLAILGMISALVAFLSMTSLWRMAAK